MKAATRVTSAVLVIAALAGHAAARAAWRVGDGEDVDVVARAQTVLADEEHQTVTPPVEEPTATGAPPAPWPARRPSRQRPPDDEGGAVLAQVLLLAMAVTLVVFGVRWSRARLSAPVRDATLAPTPGVPPGPPPSPGDRPLALARRLAEQGRFSEALRALLGHTTAALAEARDVRLPASLTGREAPGRLGLEGEQRQAFEALVMAVEVSTFGGRRADASDWNAAVQRYRRLAGGGAAT